MTISKAQEMGKQAFLNDTASAPFLDKEFMEILANANENNTLTMLEDWVRGWHSENLKDQGH